MTESTGSPLPCPEGTRVPTDRLVLVPHLLLERKAELGLSSGHLETLLQLLSFRWTDTQEPFPRVKTLAKRMGKHHRTVRRYLHDLEDMGLLEIRYCYLPDEDVGDVRQTSSEYDLTPLFRVLGVSDPVAPREHAPVAGSSIPPMAGAPRPERYKGNQDNRSTRNERYSQPARADEVILTSRGYSLSRLDR